MKVRDVMTQPARCCGPETNLAVAAETMWNNDCGFLPVVEGGALVGVVTDRDICIALGTRNQLAADVLVRDVMTGRLQICEPGEELHTAMARMSAAKVHRLPVIQDGKVEGILSLDDVLLAANRIYGAVDYTDLVNTMIAVNDHGGHKFAPSVAVA